jgi:hypothetical protein
MSKKEDVDKLVLGITTGAKIYGGVLTAKEDDNKVSWTEGASLALKYGGDAFNFFKSLPEVGNEIADIDSAEGEEVATAIEGFFPNNPKAKEGAKKCIQAAILMKEGLTELVGK